MTFYLILWNALVVLFGFALFAHASGEGASRAFKTGASRSASTHSVFARTRQ